MKIVICGSMRFAKEMLEVEEELRKMGHEPILPIDTTECAEDSSLNQNVSFCLKNDVMKDHLRKIKEADAILVLNLKKGRIHGYIGSSTLVEMGFAHFLDKEIYLFNRIPKQSCSVEVKIMKPKVLHGNLRAINDEPLVEPRWNGSKCYRRVYQQLFLAMTGQTGPKATPFRKPKAKGSFRHRKNNISLSYDIERYIGEIMATTT